MPIYEYECTACGETFEHLIRSAKEEREAACTACGSRKIKRRLSVFSAHAAESRPALPPGGCGQCCSADGGCPYAE